MTPWYLLYLDAYHLGDTLFLQSLARALGGSGGGAPPSVVVHGSGEEAERMLEGEGLFIQRVNGVLQVSSAEEAALVERALRQLNRKLVALFTDAVVATVGVVGTDRRLLQVQADGRLGTGPVEWLRDLIGKRVVPIVGALAADATGRTGEVDPVEAALALGGSIGADRTTFVFFTTTNLPGIMDGRTPRAEVGFDELVAAGVVAEPEAIGRVLAAGHPVLLTNTTRLGDRTGPTGTRVVR